MACFWTAARVANCALADVGTVMYVAGSASAATSGSVGAIFEVAGV